LSSSATASCSLTSAPHAAGEGGALVAKRGDGYPGCVMSERRPTVDDDTGVTTQTRTERKLKKPKLYKVLLHNDDYTTMEFVVFILMSVFHRSETDAVHIMLHVHKNGVGVAGVYTYEVAETRTRQVEELARQHEFPLRSSLEEA